MSMKSLIATLGLAALALPGCASAPVQPQVEAMPAPVPTRQELADEFLKAYYGQLGALEKSASLAYWRGANTGSAEDFNAYAQADLERRLMHNDAARYGALKAVLAADGPLDPRSLRGLKLAELAFKAEQLPKDLVEKMVKAQAEIEQIFAKYRPVFEGKETSTNDLLDVLKKEKDSARRQRAWEASKEVGGKIAPRLVALAKLRNEAARSLGYANYWEMQVSLQEWDPATLMKLFAELETLTNEPFGKMKATLDAEVGKRLKIKPAALMPWHYDNPFFQAVPPSPRVDLDDFYKAMAKEDIVRLSTEFFNDIGLDAAPLVAVSDFYERDGKNQHAFCITIDRAADVRMLLNIRPTEQWMGTMLHEAGHGLYYHGIDPSLPYNLREAAHIFTTEAVAMLFGALSANPTWLTQYAKADPAKVKKFENDILEQRRREQLVFVRWGMVMLNFEKAFYENPESDLDAAWAAAITRYQGLTAPKGRHGDWAAKPHFTIAPVYYHNYVAGELFAAQIRGHLAEMARHEGKTALLSFNGRKDFGTWMTEKLFRPGMTMPWNEFVESAVGKPLSADAFASEVR